MTGGAVWVEAVDRVTGGVLSRMPVFPASNGPAGYVEALCARMTAVSATDWRICSPQPLATKPPPVA